MSTVENFTSCFFFTHADEIHYFLFIELKKRVEFLLERGIIYLFFATSLIFMIISFAGIMEQ